jgi:ATP-dependent Clp protease ATP-binding subunit ClpA
VDDKKKDWLIGKTRLDPKPYSAKALKVLDFFKHHIKGQDDAILDLIDAIEIRDAGFRAPDKTIYSGLFLGGSGVGKTLFAQTLALYLFGDRASFTYIDCSLYSARHEVSRLFGAPPGYIGFSEQPILAQENIDKYAMKESEAARNLSAKDEEAKKALQNIVEGAFNILARKYGSDPSSPTFAEEQRNLDKVLKHLTRERSILLNKMKAFDSRRNEITVQNPESIILFDEIEKADPTLHKALLGILDNARAQMAAGKETRFNNSYIFMTSNIGGDAIAKISSGAHGIGFSVGNNNDPKRRNQNIYQEAMKRAEAAFPPEFLARLDRISVFRQLSRETLMEIFNVEIQKFEESYLSKYFIYLKLSDEVKKLMVDEATDRSQNGARLLKHKIAKYLKRYLARLKNRGELVPGDTVHVLMDGNGELEFYSEPGTKLIGPPSDIGPLL